MSVKSATSKHHASSVKQLAHGAVLSVSGKLGGKAMKVATEIVIARSLGAEVFGAYAIGLTVFNLGALITPLGLHNASLRFGGEYYSRQRAQFVGVAQRALVYSLIFGGLVSTVLYLLAPWMAARIFRDGTVAPVLQVFAVALFFRVGLQVAASITRVTGTTRYEVWSLDVGQPLAALLSVGLIFLVRQQLMDAVILTAASWGVGFLIAALSLARIAPDIFTASRPSPVPVKGMLAYSLPTLFASTFLMLNFWIDRLLLGYFSTTYAVGIYQAAAQIAMTQGIILGGFNAIFSPMISRLYAEGAMEQLRNLYAVSTRWALYLCVPIAVVFLFAPTEVIGLFYGSEYATGTLPFSLLTVSQLVNVGTGAVGFLLLMTGHQIRWMQISALAFLGNLLLSTLLIPKYGSVGAALATTFGMTVNFGVGLWAVSRWLGMIPYDRNSLRLVLGLFTALLLAVGVGRVVGPGIHRLIWLSLLVPLGFYGSLLVYGFEQEEIALFYALRRRVGSFSR